MNKSDSSGIIRISIAKMSALIERALDIWFAPISPLRLQYFERVFAFTFLLYTAAWFRHGREWLTDYGYHLSESSIHPAYPPPFPTLEQWMLPWFAIILFGAPCCVILGIVKRPAIFICFALAVYLQRVDVISAFTINKVYVVVFFLLMVAPGSRLIAQARSQEQVIRQSAWPVRTLQLTLIIMYCTAGTCKLIFGDWLKAHDILYGHVVGIYRTDLASFLVHRMPHWTWIIQTKIALLFELGAPVWFLTRRLRVIAIIWGLGFHLIIALLMKD